MGIVLWDPYTVTESCQLERVQRRYLSSADIIIKINHPPRNYSLVTQEICLISLAELTLTSNVLKKKKKLVDDRVDTLSLLPSVNIQVTSRTTRYRVPSVEVLAHTIWLRQK